MTDQELPARILETARSRGIMLATAESCTGGLVSAALTDIAGSSDVFDRGFVTYSYASKTDLLGVDGELLHAQGAVSEQVALVMARGALDRSCADIAVAVTGVAGPGASEAKPEGTVWFATAGPEGDRARLIQFGPLGRAEVRRRSTETALELLFQALGGAPDP